MKRFARAALLSVVAGWLLTACAHAPTPLPTATTKIATDSPADPLAHLNQIFREDYAWQRQEILRSGGPWIWASGDHLILFHGGKRQEGTGIPHRYHVLKAFSHVPLAVFVVLATDTNDPLSTEAVRRASELRAEIATLEKSLDKYVLTDKERTRQRKLLEESDDFLEHVLRDGRVDDEDLHAFTRRQRQPVMANVAEAARLQIETMDAQIKKWRAELGFRDWNRLMVVISGPAPPRARNIVTQYFARVLHEKGEGRRILYAENIYTESGVQDRLGTDLLDLQIGDAFFEDERRMFRDLLSDAATQVLHELDEN